MSKLVMCTFQLVEKLPTKLLGHSRCTHNLQKFFKKSFGSRRSFGLQQNKRDIRIGLLNPVWIEPLCFVHG